jgi:hypothetical protein
LQIYFFHFFWVIFVNWSGGMKRTFQNFSSRRWRNPTEVFIYVMPKFIFVNLSCV